MLMMMRLFFQLVLLLLLMLVSGVIVPLMAGTGERERRIDEEWDEHSYYLIIHTYYGGKCSNWDSKDTLGRC